jgi:hypothetical protein
MKELLKRYRDIQDDHDMLNALSDKYIGIDDETTTIEQALLVTSNCLTSVAHEIVTALQQELDDAAKQPNELQPECKPLWAVIAAGEPDYEARSRGIMGSTKYRMFFTKEDAEESIGDSVDRKVVQVWGE